MPKKIIIYSCSFCGNFKQVKKESVLKHESRCFANPKNKACLTCVNCVRRLRKGKERELYIGYVYTCKKTGISMFNIKSDERVKINIDFRGKIIARYSKLMLYINTEKGELLFPTSNCLTYKKRK